MSLSLRNLLVVLAGLSTVLAGIRGSQDSAPQWYPALVGLGSGALDGSREDDSGTPSEDCEEDDRETQGEREVHLLATTVLACAIESSGVFFQACCRDVKPWQHGRASWIRGPPAAV